MMRFLPELEPVLPHFEVDNDQENFQRGEFLVCHCSYFCDCLSIWSLVDIYLGAAFKFQQQNLFTEHTEES